MSTPEIRESIVEAARRWLGVKWRHQGRSQRTGVDCVGLIICVAKELGLADFDTTNYRRRAGDQTLTEPFYEYCTRKPILDGLPGDIYLMQDTSYPCHAAWISHDQKIIHAAAHYRRVLEEPIGAYYNLLTHCFEIQHYPK